MTLKMKVFLEGLKCLRSISMDTYFVKDHASLQMKRNWGFEFLLLACFIIVWKNYEERKCPPKDSVWTLDPLGGLCLVRTWVVLKMPASVGSTWPMTLLCISRMSCRVMSPILSTKVFKNCINFLSAFGCTGDSYYINCNSPCFENILILIYKPNIFKNSNFKSFSSVPG